MRMIQVELSLLAQTLDNFMQIKVNASEHRKEPVTPVYKGTRTSKSHIEHVISLHFPATLQLSGSKVMA